MKNVLIIGFACFILLGYAKVQAENVEGKLNMIHSELMDSSASVCTTNLLAASSQPVGLQIKNFFAALFDTKSWPPRWQCGEWTTFHGWFYIISDLLIWLTYFAIPAILGFFVIERKTTAPFKTIFILFIGFILSCGLTHLIDAVIFWIPAYRLSALVRFITAGISLATVFALVKAIPRARELKSQEALELIIKERTQELLEANAWLEEEIFQRQKAELELKQLNEALEEKVIKKTADIQAVNNELSHMNQLMESLQQHIHIGIWELDLESKISFWSDEVFTIHELPVQSHVSLENGINFYHPDYRKLIEEAVEEAITLGKSYDLELKIITNKKNEIWVRTIGVPIKEDGKTTGLKGLFQNIDQSKKAEEELRSNQEILNLAIEAGEVGVFFWDHGQKLFKNLNKYTNRHFGFPEEKESIELQELKELLHPNDVSRVLSIIENDFNGQSHLNINFRIITTNGSINYLSTSGFIFRNEQGKTESIAGITINISKFKKLEATLRESEEKFRLAVEHSPIGKALVGLDGKFLTVNKALLDLVGYSEEELLKLDFQDITHEEDLDADLTFVRQLLAGTRDTYQMEKRYFHKDGHLIWIQLNGTLVRNEAGTPLYFIAQIQDITNRKNSEIEINHINSMLKIRTEELEVLNKELEGFSYSVSHDLRAPLRSIVGYAKILDEDYAHQLDEEGNKTLQVIIRNGRKMGQLIDDLLEFSRLGRKDVEKQMFNMNKMVKDVYQELKAFEPDRIINIKINPLHNATVDINMIRQVWVNLISNAIKYTRNNESTEIEIGSTETEQEVCFYIRDNGVGFNMEYKSKLFNVFQRLHSAEEFEGTGVGLALIKRILDKHGGKIWAEAEENKGAIFYFTLPKLS